MALSRFPSAVSKLPMLASLLLISMLLFGCVTDQSAPVASAAAPPPIPHGQAGISITRLDGFYGSLVAADIQANGNKIASLDKGATYSGGVPPGPVTLTVSCACDLGRYSIHFNAQAGKNYAFEVSPRNEQYAAVVFGGLVGYAVDAAANGENSGMFKIVAAPSGRT